MHAVPASDPHAPRSGRWLPLLVLFIGLALTAAFAAWSWQRERSEELARFDRRVDRFAQMLGSLVQSYIDTLPGLRVFDASNANLSDAAFSQYVEAISLQRRFPGLALTFVAERLQGDELAGFVRSVREDRSRRADGHPGFDVRPPGQRAQHMVIRHVQPADDGAFGYDLYDPTQNYRPEVDAALRDGGYVATGPILLARDRFGPKSPERTSVVIRAATYPTVLVPESEQERERLAEGVVGIAFRTAELVRSAIPPGLERYLHVRIADQRATAAGQPAEVFDSAWLDPQATASASGPQQRLTLDVADRRWELVVSLREGAVLHTPDASSAMALLLGVLLSTSLAAMTRTLVRAAANEARKVREATGQLQAEKRSVEQSEQRYRMLFENSLDAVLRTRPDGSVLAANPAACALFGHSEAELKTLGRDGLIDPADSRVAELLDQRERTGRAQGQMRMLRADGRLFEAEVSASAYVDVDGQSTNSLIVRDVTERERAAARQAQLTAILDATPDFVGSADPQGRLNFLNRAARRMLGIAETEALPELDFAHCHPDWAAQAIVEVGVPAALRSGVWAGQTAITCADGRELPVSQVIICLRDAQGRVTSLATVARDLSDLHAAQAQQQALEARLLEAQKIESIGTLAGGVAHDFNNVLAAILGNLSIARDDLGIGHPVQQHLAMVQQAATRARSLVQQILAFSRRLPQERVVQPLAPLVSEALALLRATLPASVQLEAHLSEQPLTAEVDAAQVQQVVLNLCNNAWQALPGQIGRIAVHLDAVSIAAGDESAGPTPPGRYARLSVVDDGSGMDEATRARIFEPFFTTKPVGQGTGLGLAVVHGIVAASGGSIAVHSQRGLGTRIDVHLPLRDASGSAPAVAAPGADGAQRGRGEHVLLADDDEVVGLTLQALLERAGYRVTRVGSGVAAIDEVRLAPGGHDLVVTDFNMPGLSGLSVAEQLAEIAPGLPVIITSGYVTEELMERARGLGVRAVLLKEHSLERLARSVRESLAGAAADGDTPAGVSRA
ncbi:MAG TPA: PAS domain S-box protein [Piscinibacter sp.]|nr:PAS domain S-box protein [Piscinibacter sp.]HPM66686.1 PAS domain S-box protein [Piscinibacter sp.]